MKEDELYFVGVDVGTASVRAALFTANGTLKNLHIEKIEIYNPKEDFYEQSSSNIWEQVCKCVKKVTEKVSDKSTIKGLGFDATSSLVVLDENFQPVSISSEQNCTDMTIRDVRTNPLGNGVKRDIIMWMDHRAQKETHFINSKILSLVNYAGGKVYQEMQIPKILWIKTNLEKAWLSAGYYFCLPDFLTFKATGNMSRSITSLTCKWNYGMVKGKLSWNDNYMRSIGLGNLICNDHKKIGSTTIRPGELCGHLNDSAAASMGLLCSTAVGGSMIDANAGGLGLLSSRIPESICGPGFKVKLALISGTSTCNMCFSQNPVFIESFDGPYPHLMVPGLWVNVTGQSATGSLVDHIIKSHIPDNRICADFYSYLDKKLNDMATQQGLENISLLTKDLHVYPDFHGNRAPLDDHTYKGMMCGLTLDSSEDTLALKYLATLQALVYGTKDIVNKLKSGGVDVQIVLMCGGLSKSKVFVQLYADVLEIPVIIPHTKETVLLGSMMLGAAASGYFGEGATMVEIGPRMGSDVDAFVPSVTARKFHIKKFEVFKMMQANWKSYQNIMNS